MNDFGFALAWLAIQVAFLLIPAILLQALASRKGPAPGAWVATWSLALVVVLGVSMAWPLVDWRANREPASMARTTSVPTSAVRPIDASGPIANHESSDRSTARVLSFETIRAAWSRFERRAAEPVWRFRPWGRIVAIVGLAGSGLGLVRLTLGLWAVSLCRRRGRVVLDPALLGLMDELRASMGCRPTVEVREVPDLATPATAGWRRPLLLLPDDWRTWDESERRAVLAHELAHILRGDYAAGLVARLALVIHFYHPLVRWMAARLTLQQELAADALGAEFAGGRTSYLVALSSLALKQDGRSPTWPVRAFLPTRGTLIRRIKMLRVENGMKSGRGWSKRTRLALAFGLVGLTVGVASLKQPARAADEPAAPAAKPSPEPRIGLSPFDMSYIPEGLDGVFAIHLSALSTRPGMEILDRLIRERVVVDRGIKDGKLTIDRSLADAMKLTCKDIESVVIGLKFGQKKQGPEHPEGEQIGTIEFRQITVRTVAPIKWLEFVRQLKLGPDQEVRVGDAMYYKVKDPKPDVIVMAQCMYLPDDRTAVFGEETWIKQVIARKTPSIPKYLRAGDWERTSRGLLAFVLNMNNDGFVSRMFDPRKPQDAAARKFFEGIEGWVIGLEDTEDLSFFASAACATRQARTSLIRSFDVELKNLRDQLEDEPATDAVGKAVDPNIGRLMDLYKGLLANFRVEEQEGTLQVTARDFAKFAAIASFLKAEMGEEQEVEKAAAVEARKAEEKSQKR